MRAHPLKAFLMGCAGFLALIPLAGLLAVTIVGIPFILVEVLAVAAAVVLGYAAVCLLAGQEISERLGRPGWNPIVFVAAYTFGLGAVLLEWFGRKKGASPREASSPPDTPPVAAPG